MLANNYRPSFARFKILWQEQNPIRDHVWKHVQHYLITNPFFRVVGFARAGVVRKQLLLEPSNHFLSKKLTVTWGGGLKILQRTGVESFHEGRPHGRTFNQESLVESI